MAVAVTLGPRALQFVERFGSPFTPARSFWVHELLEPAMLLAECAGITTRRKRTAKDRTYLRETVSRALNAHVYRATLDDQLAVAFTADCLLGAVWHSLAETLRGDGWRTCRGCDELFFPQHKNQTDFHDGRCRNRFQVAEFRRRQRGGKRR